MRFKKPKQTNIKPLKVGIIWLNFLNSNNFCKLSVVTPTIISGTTWPRPKKNRKIIDVNGLFAWDTHARSVAITGVMQGEDARPKVIPVIKGVKKDGTLSSINLILGLLGSLNFRIPKRFKPIRIAIIETLVVTIWGNCP